MTGLRYSTIFTFDATKSVKVALNCHKAFDKAQRIPFSKGQPVRSNIISRRDVWDPRVWRILATLLLILKQKVVFTQT